MSAELAGLAERRWSDALAIVFGRKTDFPGDFQGRNLTMRDNMGGEEFSTGVDFKLVINNLQGFKGNLYPRWVLGGVPGGTGYGPGKSLTKGQVSEIRKPVFAIASIVRAGRGMICKSCCLSQFSHSTVFGGFAPKHDPVFSHPGVGTGMQHNKECNRIRHEIKSLPIFYACW